MFLPSNSGNLAILIAMWWRHRRDTAEDAFFTSKATGHVHGFVVGYDAIDDADIKYVRIKPAPMPWILWGPA